MNDCVEIIEKKTADKKRRRRQKRSRSAARMNCFEKREIILLFVYTFTPYNNLLSPFLNINDL
jgi:hypothetical protein